MPVVPTAALYSARPRVDLAGEPSLDLTDGLLSLVCTETTEGLARCEAVFGNWGLKEGSNQYLYSDRRQLDFGAELSIGLGSGDRSGTVFDGRISGLEAHFPALSTPEITVLAEDRLQDLRMTRRTRTFEDLSDEDVINQVVSPHGLSADVDIEGSTHRLIAQTNQSDLAFLRDRARLVDAEIWLAGTTVHVVARSRRRSDNVELTLNSDLHEVSVLADLATQRTSVTVSGWDRTAKEVIEQQATESAIQSELNGDTSGPGLLESAFGARAETLVHTVPLSSAEAQSRADSVMRTLARRFVTAVGCSEGDARLRVGTSVDLIGLGPGFTGTYYLVEVEHTFDPGQGYLTRFRAERAGLGPQ